MWTAFLAGLATAGPCEQGGVDALVAALEHVGPEHRTALAATGLAEACPGSALAKSAAAIAQSPPDYLPMIDMKSVLEDPGTWLRVCPDGLQVAQDVAKVAAADKRAVLWKGCDLGRLDWFSEAEWAAADGTFFLALSAGELLAGSGIGEPGVRSVVRGLAGIGSAGKLQPMDVLLPMDPMLPGPGVRVLEPERPAGFVDRPEIRWSRAARKSDERVCKLVVTVRKTGELGKIDWTECPEALRGDVEEALGKASYLAATQDGVPVRASFHTRFAVR